MCMNFFFKFKLYIPSKIMKIIHISIFIYVYLFYGTLHISEILAPNLFFSLKYIIMYILIISTYMYMYNVHACSACGVIVIRNLLRFCRG